ncbi:MAG: hypothetical protein AAB402_01715 [Patescibacteria group bacterium]
MANLFTNLPDLLKDILAEDVSVDINMEIGKKYGINSKQIGVFVKVIRKVIFKTITPAELVATIKKDLGLDETKAKGMALDLLGRKFLPMQWYVGNVEGLIKELGGNLEKYVAEAKKNYPEVYAPQAKTETAPAKEPAAAKDTGEEPSILRQIEERLTSTKGRAEVLLRLTALSQQIEEAVKAQRLDEAAGEELLHSLDALSYAVNTKDLNPLEVAAIKRRLKNVVLKLGAA